MQDHLLSLAIETGCFALKFIELKTDNCYYKHHCMSAANIQISSIGAIPWTWL